MFTGIIEYVGRVKATRLSTGGGIISIDIGPLCEGTRLGDSIAVNGVCLTVVKLTGTVADFDVSGETVSKSLIGRLTVGNVVNLERAMCADGRFGGHIVQGHTDGIGKLLAIRRQGDFTEITFEVEKHLLDEIVMKGSIAVNGISLTVAKLDEQGFTAAVIPVTFKETNLSTLKIGNSVNIETDIICKTVKRQLEKLAGSRDSFTLDKLRQEGF